MATENRNTAGELLKQGRLHQRLSIAECAKRTHIAVRYIEALEDDRWDALPSESHRLGFLRLYSRFLGVSTEEALALYRQKTASPTVSKSGDNVEALSPKEPASRVRMAPRTTGWSPSSVPQLIGLMILLLIFAWVVYHALSPRLLEQNQMPWTRRRAPTQSRLTTAKTTLTTYRIRLKADSSTWLRVTNKKELLYEGILPAGATKEWSSTSPFQFKIGNIKAISLFWNDQPVDVTAGAHGNINEIRIPPQ